MISTKKVQRITVGIPKKDFDRLQRLADTYDVSLSWLTRQAIAEFLDRYQNQKLQLPLASRSAGRG